MQQISLTLRYLKYYWEARTRYRIHSPFVFEFTERVLDDNRWFYAFEEIEDLRELLLRDRGELQITDYGAGSHVSAHKVRQVRSVARHSATSPAFCQLLFRLIQLYKPKTMLELGTSLGISSLYQAAGYRDGRLVTIEGCPNTAKVAQENFDLLEAPNIELVVGQFEECLPIVLKGIGQLDYAFIDGNHQEEPTVRYFEMCLKYAHEGSIFVFDDIHWSEGMQNAWKRVQAHSQVRLSIDLFFCGIVFLRKAQREQECYSLIPSRWKPFLG